MSKISIDKIRKLLEKGWNVDACASIINKLEEFEERLSCLEQIQKDIKDKETNFGWIK